jgi:hypothetical protein
MDTSTTRPAAGHQPLVALGESYPTRARAAALARNLDLVLVPVGAALALVLGAPVFGVLVGAGAWMLQRALAAVNRRLIDRFAEPGSQLGLNFVDAFARIWVLAGAIVLAGAAGQRSDGLAAAVVIFSAYSIAFAVRIASGRPGGPQR